MFRSAPLSTPPKKKELSREPVRKRSLGFPWGLLHCLQTAHLSVLDNWSVLHAAQPVGLVRLKLPIVPAQAHNTGVNQVQFDTNSMVLQSTQIYFCGKYIR